MRDGNVIFDKMVPMVIGKDRVYEDDLLVPKSPETANDKYL